ncbi:gamma-glutamyltransferase family protein [Sphingobium lignivorans]|uniref:Gamma-glutamyltranspeptidase/glutathione hydrolase n=1 Tax=Sphingobium lignivorans TaxID=2735886 RepID=A0ABR6NF03_9SPHN|nr:gamma-glutamyltransferase [Sphingobium lignivorans]MBB5985863.1 gamma-glutamyltranspeptidase/glutathione hydrolase [Sphingobium lignivorans]
MRFRRSLAVLGLSTAFVMAVPAAISPVYAQEQGAKPAAHARSAMVSANHPIVSRAMLDTLKKGGNAMDAALVGVIMQPIIEPQMTTLAGGMSILYYEAKTGKYYYLDAELDHSSKGAKITPSWTAMTTAGSAVPETSGIRIGVPGTVAGLKAAADRFGSLKWADYFQPSIKVAEQGFPMYSFLYGDMAEASIGRLAAYPSGREEFMPQGYVPPVGTTVTRPRLAATLKRIAAADGVDYFYKGAWAQKFVSEVQRTGGMLSMADLAGYQVRWNEPVRTTYKDFEIISAPPPSTAGTLIGMILNIIEPWDLKAAPHFTQSAESFARIRQAFAFAESATDMFIKDPLSFNLPVESLLSKDYAAILTAQIDGSMPKTVKSAAALPPSGMEFAADFSRPDPHKTDTDHIVAVDKDGNMVSVTHTVYGSTFGTGLVVDGVVVNTGNGFPGTDKGPGKRVISPFPPTIVAKAGKPELVIGSPGLSSRAVALTLINYLGYGMSLEQSVDAPRFSGSQPGVPTIIETRVSEAVRESLKTDYGVAVHPTTPYNWHLGSIHAIARGADGTLTGVADPRRSGEAIGY